MCENWLSHVQNRLSQGGKAAQPCRGAAQRRARPPTPTRDAQPRRPKTRPPDASEELQEGTIGLRNYSTTVKADALMVGGHPVALTKDDAWVRGSPFPYSPCTLLSHHPRSAQALVDGFSSLIGEKEPNVGALWGR